jgi:hypothetical protein
MAETLLLKVILVSTLVIGIISQPKRKSWPDVWSQSYVLFNERTK